MVLKSNPLSNYNCPFCGSFFKKRRKNKVVCSNPKCNYIPGTPPNYIIKKIKMINKANKRKNNE